MRYEQTVRAAECARAYAHGMSGSWQYVHWGVESAWYARYHAGTAAGAKVQIISAAYIFSILTHHALRKV